MDGSREKRGKTGGDEGGDGMVISPGSDAEKQRNWRMGNGPGRAEGETERRDPRGDGRDRDRSVEEGGGEERLQVVAIQFRGGYPREIFTISTHE